MYTMRTLSFLSFSFLLFIQSPVFGHESATGGGHDHLLEDSVVVTPELEQALAQSQKATQPISLQSALVAGQEYLYGKWAGPYDWPVLAAMDSYP